VNRVLGRQIKDYLKGFIRPRDLVSVPAVVDKPEGSRVLVLSPHFDDDVFGCGGTLYKHVLAQDSVAVVYLTDGREGDPSVPDKRLVEETRKEEARRATAILGIDRLIFLDQPDGRLRPTARLIDRLAEIVSSEQPDLIYLPSFLENHIDHFEVSRILLALAAKIRLECNVCAYEAWTPLLPNIVVDITDVIEKKKEAAQQYVSQLKQVDYLNAVVGLNRYRSVYVMRGRGYAEAFLFASFKRYVRLMKRLGLGRPRYFFDRKHKEILKEMVGLIKRGKRQDWSQGAPRAEAP